MSVVEEELFTLEIRPRSLKFPALWRNTRYRVGSFPRWLSQRLSGRERSRVSCWHRRRTSRFTHWQSGDGRSQRLPVIWTVNTRRSGHICLGGYHPGVRMSKVEDPLDRIEAMLRSDWLMIMRCGQRRCRQTIRSFILRWTLARNGV